MLNFDIYVEIADEGFRINPKRRCDFFARKYNVCDFN